ncbi:hypothetical protein HPP92_019694 [Vanilla planifolia]|uniref:Uncharacterized protein n=1 Tax=Vanilla planifolia TaxID=51239 RepID=A0A835Q3B9_VANPL|nr:hypothetical protein HPP92_019694 [Vanilla planifolia]
MRWCSNPQGRRTCPAAARLIALDGRVTFYRRRVKVAELMKEHACHSVCRSDEFFIGQKVPAMSAAEKLQLGQSYFLLPCHFFQSVLSFVEVASSLAGEGGRSLRHLGIHRTDMGKLQIRIAEALEGSGDWEKEGERKRGNWLVCTTSALEKEYERMVGWKSRQWRPKLDRIDESSEKKAQRGAGRRIGAWGVLMRRKKSHKSVA